MGFYRSVFSPRDTLNGRHLRPCSASSGLGGSSHLRPPFHALPLEQRGWERLGRTGAPSSSMLALLLCFGDGFGHGDIPPAPLVPIPAPPCDSDNPEGTCARCRLPPSPRPRGPNTTSAAHTHVRPCPAVRAHQPRRLGLSNWAWPPPPTEARAALARGACCRRGIQWPWYRPSSGGCDLRVAANAPQGSLHFLRCSTRAARCTKQSGNYQPVFQIVSLEMNCIFLGC
jgi:hypothetical protein